MYSLKIITIPLLLVLGLTLTNSLDNIVCKTQLPSPQELLLSKNWNIKGKSKDIYYQYTEQEKILYVEGQIVGRANYYISETNCFKTTYDSTKEGQTNDGRFLITDDGSCFYLTVINATVIQLSYLSEDNPMTTTLIAVEE